MIKSWLPKFIGTILPLITPGLKEKAEATATPLDDFGVACLREAGILLADGELTPQDAIASGVMVFNSFIGVLEHYAEATPGIIDDAALDAVKAAAEALKPFIFKG